MIECIEREIDFLRELEVCENVITLEGVYRSRTEKNQGSCKKEEEAEEEEVVIQLVLKFA